MEQGKEVTILMDQLSQTYADPKVKADYYLAKLILKCAKVLDKTSDVNLVSAGYSVNINSYVFYLRTQKRVFLNLQLICIIRVKIIRENMIPQSLIFTLV